MPVGQHQRTHIGGRPAHRGQFPAEAAVVAGQARVNNGHLPALLDQVGIDHGVAADSVDNRILSVAFGIQKAQPRSQTILVSKDINLRIKADAAEWNATHCKSPIWGDAITNGWKIVLVLTAADGRQITLSTRCG